MSSRPGGRKRGEERTRDRFGCAGSAACWEGGVNRSGPFLGGSNPLNRDVGWSRVLAPAPTSRSDAPAADGRSMFAAHGGRTRGDRDGASTVAAAPSSETEASCPICPRLCAMSMQVAMSQGIDDFALRDSLGKRDCLCRDAHVGSGAGEHEHCRRPPGVALLLRPALSLRNPRATAFDQGGDCASGVAMKTPGNSVSGGTGGRKFRYPKGGTE
jgi:hypothetical protein